MSRFLRQLNERQRYTAARPEATRTHVYLSGAIPDELDEGKTQREMLLPEAIIHGGLPPSPAYDTHMDEAIMATAESVLA
jgi:hypothetical protein